MFKNYLKITLRSLMKSKVFVLINVLGMGVALACCIVAYLNYDYNNSYDKEHVNASSIYRVNFVREFQGNTTKYGITPTPMALSVRQNLTEVENIIRYSSTRSNIRIGDELFRTRIGFADPELLKVFTYNLLSGSTKDFDNKGNILISDELASKYFGEEDPLGKQITQPYGRSTKEYIVGGVFEKLPQNSSIRFDALTLYDNFFDLNPDVDEHGWRSYTSLFLNITDKTRIPIITEQLQSHIEAQNNARDDFHVTRFYLDPLVGMAVRGEKEQISHYLSGSMPTAAVVAPTVMAVLLLLIACFNFTNTSIAISSKRLKEIGIRKVMGGMRKHLILQFLGENILLCLMALVAGLIMAEFLVPAYNEMWDFMVLDLSYTENLDLILFLFGLLIATGLIAGSYPALYITKFEPTEILKGTFKVGGTSILSKVLLTFQFMFTLLAVIMGLAFIQNAEYQQAIDVGFDKKGVIYARLQDQGEYETYRNSLASETRITSMAGSKDQIFSSYYNDPIKFEDKEVEVDILDVGDEYISTMGMTILKGRDFRMDSETDRGESAIVNEAFVKMYGWDDPISKRVVWMDTVQLYIVGVVKDFYINGFWDPLKPTMLRNAPKEDYRYLIVTADASDIIAVNESMEAAWKELFRNKLYNADFLDENMASSLEVNTNIVTMFTFLGIVATLLSISGLYTLVSLNIIKRMKEIGVRRVLGASVGNVIKIVNRQFAIILFIAAILGSGLSYVATDAMMSSIWAYYLNAGFVTFLIPTLFIFAVSALVVISKVAKAANANPALTLRDE
jgi:ABC-type lipoprotein release transport system permease subunit